MSSDFKKENLEKEVLNRLKWDRGLNPGDYTILYLDRVSTQLKEVRYSDIVHGGDFFAVGDSQIPAHRIREIRHKGKTVWARRKIGNGSR